jgi:hypothetical protein
MDPYDIRWLGDSYNFTAEYLVDLEIGIPGLSAVYGILGEIVKEWPDRPIAEAVVVIFHVGLLYENRMAVLLLQLTSYQSPVFFDAFEREPRPSYPNVIV